MPTSVPSDNEPCSGCGQPLNAEREALPDGTVTQCPECGRFSLDVTTTHLVMTETVPKRGAYEVAEEPEPEKIPADHDPFAPVATVVKYWRERAEDKQPFNAILEAIEDAKSRG